MNIYKKAVLTVISAVFLTAFSLSAFADGDRRSNEAYQAYSPAESGILDGISAESAVVIETKTGTVLAQINPDEKRSVSHLAKLMTILIAAEKISCGELSENDTVTVSAHANSMSGTQIWLNVGEKITVEELLKSITIGNANDACVALAEKIAGSEESFVSLMNEKALQLGMSNTVYADCTGISENTVSTAGDTAVLSCEILKYDFLTPYLTTWIDKVRSQETELVSTNRMIRTYKGVTGLKSCASSESGECLAVSSSRSDMSVCAVLLGCSSDDAKFSDGKKALDGAFGSFEIYTPEIPDEVYEKIRVNGGEEMETAVATENTDPIIIPKGSYPSVECEFTKAENIDAPVSKGQALGKINFTLDGEKIIEGSIVSETAVEKIGFVFALKKVLLNLLNI